jgi:hypothetical protein
MAYDNRKPGEANIAAWTEAAARGRWSFEAALEAIHTHYVTSTDFLMPAHITMALRAKARQPTPFAELEASQPASVEHAERMSALIRDTFAMPKPTDDRPRSVDESEAREAARAELEALRLRKAAGS